MNAAEPMTTAVIGAGRLARALLPLLGPAGYPVVAVAARRSAAARAAARGLARVRATTSLRGAVEDARLVLLAVPDAAVRGGARTIAAPPGFDWSGRTVLHHAGALGVEPLETLARAGAGVGVLHPLQCLGTASAASRLVPGSRARIDGDRRGRPVASRLARDLGLVPLRLPRGLTESQRATYHAAAALVSNDLVALLALGTEMLESIGLSRRAAREALLPLARGTLDQLSGAGIRGAITGPVARGDLETLRGHLRALGRRSKAAAEVHRLLSRRLARLVREQGVRSHPGPKRGDGV